MKGFFKRFTSRNEEEKSPHELPSSQPSGIEIQHSEAVQPQEAGSQKIVLELGDVLGRIPPRLLKEGSHDPSRRIFFKISELSANLAEGKATIPLSQIASRCPDIFKHEIGPDDDVEIFFPWRKLLDRVRNLKALIDAPNADSPGQAFFKAAPPPSQTIKLRQQASRIIAEKERADADTPADEASPENPAPAPKLAKQNWFGAQDLASIQPLESLKPQADLNAPVSDAENPPPQTIPAAPLIPPPASEKAFKLAREPLPRATTEKPPTSSLMLKLQPQASLQQPPPPPPESTDDERLQTLTKECANLFEEKNKLAAEFANAQQAHRQLIERLTKEREEMQSQKDEAFLKLTEARAEHEAKLQALRDDFSKQAGSLRDERDRAGKEKDGKPDQESMVLPGEKDEALAKLVAELESHKKQAETLGKELAETRAAHEAKLKNQHEDFTKQIASLKNERDRLTKERETALAAQRDEAVSALSAKIEAQKKQIETLDRERVAFYQEKVKVADALVEARIAHKKKLHEQHGDLTKQIAALKEERDRAMREKEELASRQGAGQQGATIARQREESLTRLTAEIGSHKKQIDALGRERAAFVEEKEKLARELAGAKAAHEQKLREQREDFEKQIAALKDGRERALKEKEEALSKHNQASEQEHAALVKQKDASLAALAAEIESHKKQAESLGKEREIFHEEKGNLVKALADAKAAHERKFLEMHGDLTAQIAALKDERDRLESEKNSALSHHRQASEQERATLVKQREESLAALNAEIGSHKNQLEDLGRERAAFLDEKQKLAKELAAARADHGKKLEEMQGDMTRQIAALKAERNRIEAEKNTALSRHQQTSGQEIAQLRRQAEAVAQERDKAVANHREAVEAKRAQWAVFGNEFNQVVRQRDEAIEELKKKTEAVAKEKDRALSMLQKSHSELERQVAELHTKFDNVAKQKDALKSELDAAKQAHKNEAERLAEERDSALKAQEGIMALPRIRPVMIAPPVVQATPEPNS